MCKRVAELIEVLPNLRKLDIETAETAMDCYPALSNTLARSTSLESLRLDAQDCETLAKGSFRLLKSLHSPLRKITLEPFAVDWCTFDVLDLLLNFTATLEEVKMTFMIAVDWNVSNAHWPHVHTVTLDCDARVNTAVLEQAFPALRNLTVFDDWMSYNLPLPHVQANRAHECTTWTRLSYLRGNIAGLWSLALSGVKVDLLDIQKETSTHFNLRAVEDIVASVQPCTLCMHIPKGFMPALGNGAGCLAVLEIHVMDTDAHPGTIVDYFVSHLHPCFASNASGRWDV